jgi:RND family efflux transporter MFP subunit
VPPARAAATRPPKRRFRTVAIVGLVAGVTWFLWHRAHANHTPAGKSGQAAPVVAVEKVEQADLSQTLSLAAEFRAFQQVSLHAKVSGFLQSISVEIGDRVKEGQVIAQLDVPEQYNDLEKATAAAAAAMQEVARAEAAASEAHLSFTRLRGVADEHPKLVAQAELDTATARDAASASSVAAAKQKVEESQAEIKRVKAMIGYTTMCAPFSGTITRRNADPGALIQAGTSSNTQPLVEIAQDSKLRLTFPVPEATVPLLTVGAPVHVLVRTLDAQFDGKISRFTGKIDRATRTMWTEVDVENPDGKFKPGMIAEVTLTTREKKGALAVPVQAIAPGEKPSVLVVGGDGVLQKREVKLGLETPHRTEVLDGLHAGDLVIVGTKSGLQSGQKVVAQATHIE